MRTQFSVGIAGQKMFVRGHDIVKHVSYLSRETGIPFVFSYRMPIMAPIAPRIPREALWEWYKWGWQAVQVGEISM